MISTDLRAAHAATPPLRLISYTTARPSAAMSLGQFYETAFCRFFLEPRGAQPNTFKEYETTLTYWAAATGDPPLRSLTALHTSEFTAYVRQLPGLHGGEISPNTVRKHAAQLQTILDFAGPPSRTMRNAQNLIGPLYVERPRQREKPPTDGYTLPELADLLAATPSVTTPAYLEPRDRPTYWRTLLAAGYNTGARIGSLLAARWDQISRDRESRPWLAVPVKRGHVRRVYLNPFALEAIEAMRPLTGDRPKVWHWPYSLSYLQCQRRHLAAAAGLPPDRRLGFHALRKAMITECSAVDPLAASLQAGHADFRTTQNHYIHPGRVAAGMQNLAQPIAREGTPAHADPHEAPQGQPRPLDPH